MSLADFQRALKRAQRAVQRAARALERSGGRTAGPQRGPRRRRKTAPRPAVLRPPRLSVLARRGKLTIYIVDGLKTRKKEIAFTMGGHDLVYPGLVPKNEVWIDNALNAMDRKYTMLHELHERRLMKTRGMGYDEAHESANQIEQRYRQANGKGLASALRRERGQ